MAGPCAAATSTRSVKQCSHMRSVSAHTSSRTFTTPPTSIALQNYQALPLHLCIFCAEAGVLNSLITTIARGHHSCPSRPHCSIGHAARTHSTPQPAPATAATQFPRSPRRPPPCCLCGFHRVREASTADVHSPTSAFEAVTTQSATCERHVQALRACDCTRAYPYAPRSHHGLRARQQARGHHLIR
jgi:hypothetical protein